MINSIKFLDNEIKYYDDRILFLTSVNVVGSFSKSIRKRKRDILVELIGRDNVVLISC